MGIHFDGLGTSAKGQLAILVKSLAIFFAVEVVFEIEPNLAFELQMHMRTCVSRTKFLAAYCLWEVCQEKTICFAARTQLAITGECFSKIAYQ